MGFPIISGILERIHSFIVSRVPERSNVKSIKSIFRNPLFAALSSLIIYFLPRISYGIIVDVACGYGWLSGFLNRLGMYVLGIDISRDAILNAKKNFPGPSYIIASALKLPLKNSSVSTVISIETIEHLKDGESFLREIYRILKVKGVLLLSTINGDSLYHRIYRVLTGKNCVICRFHIHEYNQHELIRILEDIGFSVREKGLLSFVYPIFIPQIALLYLLIAFLTSKNYWLFNVKDKSLMGVFLLFNIIKEG
ncbi:MAG: class I SAM-dependent methyltransferase [Candidatus Methanomethylicia archaeon]